MYLSILSLVVACVFQPLGVTQDAYSNGASPTKVLIEGQNPVTKHDTEALGQLAIIGNDGNVYVSLIGSDGQLLDQRQITTDATAALEAKGRSYHRLSWSTDGHLAFAAMDRSTHKVEGQLYTVPVSVEHRKSSLTVGEPSLIWRGDGGYVIYISWAPSHCANEPSCSQLAFLEAIPETMRLHVIQLSNANPVSKARRLLQTGRPFYFSWSHRGDSLLWHINGSALHNPDAALGRTDFVNDLERVFDERPGSFLAPAWSPTAEHWLAVTLNRSDELAETGNKDASSTKAGELRLFEGRHAVTIADVPINAQYVWSPDGDTVAYAHRQSVESGRFGPIHLYDVERRETRLLTSPTWNVRGFFWSPDGQHIAYIHDLGAPDPRWMQWRIISVDHGEENGYSAFRAAFGMRFILGSFSQYAQSHRYWSPNGRYLLMVDEDEVLVTRIWLVDRYATSKKLPVSIGEGSLAVWSWGN